MRQVYSYNSHRSYLSLRPDSLFSPNDIITSWLIDLRSIRIVSSFSFSLIGRKSIWERQSIGAVIEPVASAIAGEKTRKAGFVPTQARANQSLVGSVLFTSQSDGNRMTPAKGLGPLRIQTRFSPWAEDREKSSVRAKWVTESCWLWRPGAAVSVVAVGFNVVGQTNATKARSSQVQPSFEGLHFLAVGRIHKSSPKIRSGHEGWSFKIYPDDRFWVISITQNDAIAINCYCDDAGGSAAATVAWSITIFRNFVVTSWAGDKLVKHSWTRR